PGCLSGDACTPFKAAGCEVGLGLVRVRKVGPCKFPAVYFLVLLSEELDEPAQGLDPFYEPGDLFTHILASIKQSQDHEPPEKGAARVTCERHTGKEGAGRHEELGVFNFQGFQKSVHKDLAAAMTSYLGVESRFLDFFY